MSPRTAPTHVAPSTGGRIWREWIRPFLIVGIVLFSMRSALADWNDVPTGSMRPTIVPGDRIFVNKLAWDLKIPFTTTHMARWDDPDPGDIVVFFSPFDGARLIKRVVAGPGQVVELRGDVLFVDGEPESLRPLPAGDPREAFAEANQTALLSSYLSRPHAILLTESPARPDFGPERVPDDHYFVMGDNRDDSHDSRFIGPIPRHAILGRAVGVAFSLDRSRYFLPRLDRWFESVE